MPVSALLLAAGASTRMGRPKLLLPLQGKPVLAHCLDALATPAVSRVVVVVRQDDRELRDYLAGREVEVTVNPASGSDMAESVQLGLARVGREGDGVLIFPADYPLVTPVIIDAICAQHDAAPDAIVIPVHRGRRGHPPIFPAELLSGLTPERTLRDIIANHPERVQTCDIDNPAVLRDMDTPADYFDIRLALACRAAAPRGAHVCRNG